MVEFNACEAIDASIRRAMILVLIKDYCDRNNIAIDEFINGKVFSIVKHGIINSICREKEELMKAKELMSEKMLSQVLAACNKFESELDEHIQDHCNKTLKEFESTLNLIEVLKTAI